MKNYNFLVVFYRVWLRDRENPKNILQYSKPVFNVESIEEGALRTMQTTSDAEWECYEVDLVEIYAN